MRIHFYTPSREHIRVSAMKEVFCVKELSLFG